MAATYTARTKGAVAQYAMAGNDGKTAYDATLITPAAAGPNIIGTVPPGKAGIRLTSPVIQRAADLTADGTAGVTGNALLSSTGTGLVPTVNAAQEASAGVSLSPSHE